MLKESKEQSDQMLKESKEQSDQILKESKDQYRQLLEKSDKILTINERLEEKLDTVVEDRVIYPTDDTKVQTFVLCKIGDKQYQMISGSDGYISNKVKSLKGDTILKLENVPNCYYLKILIKENMVDNYTFKNDTIKRTKSITEKKMISTVNEIYEERKNKDTI